MLRSALVSTLLVTVAAASACDPYDPMLPAVPFLCGTDDPKCPDGYREVQITGTRCECWKDDGNGGADAGVDSGPFACADDTLQEPNNNITEATPTVVGMGTNSQIFNAMAICPQSDVDVFRITVSAADTDIDVVVDFTQLTGDVEVDILNSGGDSIAAGSPSGSGRMRAFITAMVTGNYYAQVKSGNSTENNYTARLMIIPP